MLVVSSDPTLFDSVRTALRTDSRFVESQDNLHCDGSVVPLTNIYPVEMTATDWEERDHEDSLRDPQSMTTLVFECRSPAWVAEVGRLLAAGLNTTVWFVDSAGTAWPADRVDPDRVALD